MLAASTGYFGPDRDELPTTPAAAHARQHKESQCLFDADE
jgi:hypothetical protein